MVVEIQYSIREYLQPVAQYCSEPAVSILLAHNDGQRQSVAKHECTVFLCHLTFRIAANRRDREGLG